jgi:SH3 domain-containing protein
MKNILNLKKQMKISTNKYILAAALLFLMVVFSFQAIAQTYKATTPVNMREGAGKDFPIVRMLEQNEKVEKTGGQGGYIKVRTSKGEEGYVWGTYLQKDSGPSINVPAFGEFSAQLRRQSGGKIGSGPNKYFFESILEFLRIENHGIYVIMLPLFVALVLLVAGMIVLRFSYKDIDTLLPKGISRGRRRAIKILTIATGAYLVISAVAYFLDLSLHYASLEESTMLVMILSVPRAVLAGPIAVFDALVDNYILGIATLLLLVLIARPDTDYDYETDRSQKDEDYDTILTLKKPEEMEEDPESTSDIDIEKDISKTSNDKEEEETIIVSDGDKDEKKKK